jgi:hypothetical protein
MSFASEWSEREFQFFVVAAVATGVALVAATAAIFARRTKSTAAIDVNAQRSLPKTPDSAATNEQKQKQKQKQKQNEIETETETNDDSSKKPTSTAQPSPTSAITTTTTASTTSSSSSSSSTTTTTNVSSTPPRPRRARRLTDAQKTALLELNLEQISDSSDMVAHGVASVSASVSASGISTPVSEITPPPTPKPQTIASKLAALTSSASGSTTTPTVGRQRSGTSPVALSPASSVPSSAVTTPRDQNLSYQLGVASPAQPGTPQTARRRAHLKREATREFQQERAARRAAAALTLHLAEAERRLRVNEDARLRRVEWAARKLNLPTVLAQTETERQRLAQTFAPSDRVELVQRERRDQLLSLVALSGVEAQAPVRDRSVRARVSLASERAKELVNLAAERERKERERQERKEQEERETAARKEREENARKEREERARKEREAEQARVLERAESERHMEREREKQREAERALEKQREAERERDRERDREREAERERLAASLASPRKTASPKPAAVMRAVSAVGGGERCVVCDKRAYMLERVTVDGAILHKACFKCADCAGTISITSYVAHGGQYYCRIHGASKPPEPKQPATPTANPLRTRSAEKYTPTDVDETKEAVVIAAAASPSATDEGARAAIRRLVGEDVLDDEDSSSAIAVASSSDSVTEDTADASLGSSMDTTSAEDETRRFLPQPGMVRAYGGFDATFNTGKRGTVTGKAALLLWCQRSTVLYPGCEQLVSNFTTSWKNGLAFCALVDCHRPGSLQPLDYLQLVECGDDEKRLDAAFSAAELCGVPRLLDAEDLVEMSVPDQLSIITYLSEVYKCFVGNN